MAQRRMFTLQVVDSDAFLEMPQTSQLLYFHLSMRADDDGFVGNPKKIMFMIGSKEDDFKVLISKRFIIGFDTGVIVIKHWRMHNYIAKDRYNETTYIEEKSKLMLKDNGSYTDCIQDVYNVDTGKVSIGKNSIDKEYNKPKKQKKQKPVRDNGNQLINYGSQNEVLLTENEYNKLISEYGKQIVLNYINRLSCWENSYLKENHNLTIRQWMNKDNVQKIKKVVTVERRYPSNDDIDELTKQGLTHDQIMRKFNPGVEKFW